MQHSSLMDELVRGQIKIGDTSTLSSDEMVFEDIFLLVNDTLFRRERMDGKIY